MTKPIDLSTAAAALGRKGGQSTSEAKQAASRANGKRGGRPRRDNIMSGTTSQFKAGDAVQVRYSGKWHSETFHISRTWYTTANGRQYKVRENGDTFAEKDVRKAK